MEENFETTNDIPNPALIKKLKKEEKSRKLKVAKAKQLAIKKKEKSIKQILFEKKKAEERKIKFTNEDQLSRLEKYDLEDSKDADNNPFIADENFKGPEPYRKPTDRVWIIVFVILNLGLILTAVLAILNGDLNRLTTGYDFRSVLCGYDNFSDKPYLYFINPVVDLNLRICIKHCPKSTGDTICLYKPDGVTPTSFCYIQMQTTYNGKYCYPVEPVNHKIVDTYLNSFYNSVRRTVADFFIAKEVIFYGVFLAILLPLLVLVLLKHQKTVALISWGSIFLTFIVIGGYAYMFYTEYERQLTVSCPYSMNSDCAGWKPKLYKSMFIIILILGGFYLLAIIKLLGRISLAIGILKAASKTTEVLSQLRIIPILMTILGLFFGSLTVFIVLKSFGCGEVEIIAAKNVDGGQVKTIVWSAYIQWLIVYNLILLCYWLLVILGYSDLITSYALTIWFFVKNKDTVDIPVKRSFRDITKYHLGTLFFGSCANTVFGIPKMIMAFVTNGLRKSKQYSNWVRFISASCMLCIHVYQKLLRYISKNALVQTTLWGDDYYHSAKKSYFLLFRNANLTKDLDSLQSFLILQTKLCVCFFSSGCTYTYLRSFDETYILKESLKDLESPFPPTILVFFIAFFLSSIMQGSFDITSKTIIQCYLIDCEMFFGQQRYAEGFIRDFMEFFVKSSQNKIFVSSSKKKDNTQNTKKNDLSESQESDNDPNNKDTNKIQEEEEDEEEDEENESEEDEEGSEEDSQGNSENSEELDEEEKKNREADLEAGDGDGVKNDEQNFIEDASDASVEFYNNAANENEESSEGEENKGENPQNNNLNQNPSLLTNPQIQMNNSPSMNNMNNKAIINNNGMNNPNSDNIMLDNNNSNPMNSINMQNPTNPREHGIDENYPLNEENLEEWNLVNLNHSYDDIKNQVFNLMNNKKEEKSFNFFDKAQINDTTWKFEDPFDVQPSKNYRPY